MIEFCGKLKSLLSIVDAIQSFDIDILHRGSDIDVSPSGSSERNGFYFRKNVYSQTWAFLFCSLLKRGDIFIYNSINSWMKKMVQGEICYTVLKHACVPYKNQTHSSMPTCNFLIKTLWLTACAIFLADFFGIIVFTWH